MTPDRVAEVKEPRPQYAGRTVGEDVRGVHVVELQVEWNDVAEGRGVAIQNVGGLSSSRQQIRFGPQRMPGLQGRPFLDHGAHSVAGRGGYKLNHPRMLGRVEATEETALKTGQGSNDDAPGRLIINVRVSERRSLIICQQPAACAVHRDRHDYVIRRELRQRRDETRLEPMSRIVLLEPHQPFDGGIAADDGPEACPVGEWFAADPTAVLGESATYPGIRGLRPLRRRPAIDPLALGIWTQRSRGRRVMRHLRRLMLASDRSFATQDATMQADASHLNSAECLATCRSRPRRRLARRRSSSQARRSWPALRRERRSWARSSRSSGTTASTAKVRSGRFCCKPRSAGTTSLKLTC